MYKFLVDIILFVFLSSNSFNQFKNIYTCTILDCLKYLSAVTLTVHCDWSVESSPCKALAAILSPHRTEVALHWVQSVISIYVLLVYWVSWEVSPPLASLLVSWPLFLALFHLILIWSPATDCELILELVNEAYFVRGNPRFLFTE